MSVSPNTSRYKGVGSPHLLAHATLRYIIVVYLTYLIVLSTTPRLLLLNVCPETTKPSLPSSHLPWLPVRQISTSTCSLVPRLCFRLSLFLFLTLSRLLASLPLFTGVLHGFPSVSSASLHPGVLLSRHLSSPRRHPALSNIDIDIRHPTSPPLTKLAPSHKGDHVQRDTRNVAEFRQTYYMVGDETTTS